MGISTKICVTPLALCYTSPTKTVLHPVNVAFQTAEFVQKYSLYLSDKYLSFVSLTEGFFCLT